MLEGKQVLDYFKKHPECAEKLKNIKYQFRHPKTFEPDEELYRPLEVSDISFITFEGWEGQKGVFAWYYPCGVPHYTQIAQYMKFDFMIEKELKGMEYQLILESGDYAFILRGKDLKEYAVVNGLNKEDSSWAWTVTYADFRFDESKKNRAFQCCYEEFMRCTNKNYIHRYRLEELATKFKDGLLEDDSESAMEYFIDECEMEENELEYFGLSEEVAV